MERASAVAEAEAESQIKSSTWAVVSRHQTFLNAQKEHKLTRRQQLTTSNTSLASNAGRGDSMRRHSHHAQIVEEKLKEEAVAEARKALTTEIDSGVVERQRNIQHGLCHQGGPLLELQILLSASALKKSKVEYYVSQPVPYGPQSATKSNASKSSQLPSKQKTLLMVFLEIYRPTPEPRRI